MSYILSGLAGWFDLDRAPLAARYYLQQLGLIRHYHYLCARAPLVARFLCLARATCRAQYGLMMLVASGGGGGNGSGGQPSGRV